MVDQNGEWLLEFWNPSPEGGLEPRRHRARGPVACTTPDVTADGRLTWQAADLGAKYIVVESGIDP